MTEPHIGLYVTRCAVFPVATYRPLTLAHLTESLIEDEPVTRCGRRLREREGTRFRYEVTPARRVCSGCQP